jgi:diguanylate cyclase
MSRDGGGSGARRAGARAAPVHEHERTLALGEAALDRIRALKLAATPRNYEVWYAYATREYPTLNLIINDMLARRVGLGSAAIDQIGARFVSPGDLNDRIDTVGSRVASEIGQVVATIDSSIGSASACSEEMTQAGDTLAASRDRDALRAVAERMVRTASRMKDDQHRLETQFDASKSEIDQLRVQLQQVMVAALTDPLTGIANRKSLQRSLQKAMAAAAEHGEPLSVVMGDIDHFKAFNDCWGHLTGDQVLRLVAKTMKQNVSEKDVVARYGGEEFAIVMPNAPLHAAYGLADHIRRTIMSREIVNRTTGLDLGRVTVSFGVAGLRPDDSADSVLSRADACLYAAKCSGRNRVICEADPEFAGTRFETAAVA